MSLNAITARPSGRRRIWRLFLTCALVIGACDARPSDGVSHGDDLRPLDGSPPPFDAARDGNGADARSPDAQDLDAPRLDLPAHCQATTNTRELCFFGSAFADCPGDPHPALYCSAVSPDEMGSWGKDGWCIWVSNGCPVDLYHVSATPLCDQTGALQEDWNERGFVTRYGGKVWDRHRALVLPTSVDETFAPPPATRVDCSGDFGSDQPAACGEDAIFSYRSLRGTIALRFNRATPFGADREIEIEIDPREDPLKARACLLVGGGSGNCPVDYDPPCATSGAVVIDRDPSQIVDVETLHGSFDLSFSGGAKVVGAF